MTKNYYPKMKFKLSKSLDIEMAIWFFQNQNVGGVNFWTDRTGDLKKKLEKRFNWDFALLFFPQKLFNQFLFSV